MEAKSKLVRVMETKWKQRDGDDGRINRDQAKVEDKI